MNDTVTTIVPETSGATKQQMPAKTAFRSLNECRTLAQAFETRQLRDLMASAIPKNMDPDTMLRACVLAANKSPNIYKVEMRQALGAFMSLTYLGLAPGTQLQLAHLIPFGKRKYNRATKQWEQDGDHYELQVIIGYPGYVELGFRSGFIKDIATGVVYPGDQFDFERGSDRYLKHKPNMGIDRTKLDPVAAWAVAKFVNEGEEFDVMSWPEIRAIRDRAQAYRTALAAKEAAEKRGWRVPLTYTDAAWIRDEPEMGRKTVLRRASKLWPRCPELRAGIGIEDAQDGGKTLDFGPVIDGLVTPFEGIPTVEDDSDPDDGNVVRNTSRDPGAVHIDRRPTTNQKTAAPKNAPRDDPPAGRWGDDTASGGKPDAADVEIVSDGDNIPPAFEAALIDEFGDMIGEYTDAYAFALAVGEQWHQAKNKAAVIEHNEDAIDLARSFDRAAAVLAVLDEDPNTGGGGAGARMADDDPLLKPVPVPMRGSKQDWMGYRREFSATMAKIPGERIIAWLETQRSTLQGAPAAHRPMLVRDIENELTPQNIAVPGWATALKPKPRAAAEQQEEEPPPPDDEDRDGDPQTGTTNPDEIWAADTIAAMNAFSADRAGAQGFDKFVASKEVRDVMIRLRKEKSALFDQVDRASGAKYARLSAYRT